MSVTSWRSVDVGGSMSETPWRKACFPKQPHKRPHPAPPSRLGQLGPAPKLRRCEKSSFKTPFFFPLPHAFAAFAPKSVPSTHMRWSVTAIFRASATRAFLKPARFASLAAQLFSGLVPRDLLSMTFAASKR
mgnify:CR=1 FL=1